MNETSSTRLNKYLASAGICSRRKADELILAGLVKVNNKTITDLGYKVEVNDTVHYKNELVKPVTQLQYLLFNKPKDCITTLNDEKGRKTVFDFIKKYTNTRLVPVGRLDRNTTGLLLFTNDGELHHQLSHPAFEIQKIYKVKLNRNITENDFNKMAEGIELSDGFLKPDEIAILDSKSEIGIQIHSGKNRIVRRFFEQMGYEVKTLDRVFFAGLTKHKLPRSQCRFLAENEVRMLKQLVKKGFKPS